MVKRRNGMMTRRVFLGNAAVLAVGAALGLTGCGEAESEGERSRRYYETYRDDEHAMGLSVDCEVPTYDVTLVIYADEYVQWCGSSGSGSTAEELVRGYQKARPTVKVDLHYVSTEEIAKMATEDCKDAVALIGDHDAIMAGVDAGVLYGGISKTSVRYLSCWCYADAYLVRPQGSTEDLPNTVGGEEVISSDGDEVGVWDYFGDYTGMLGICAEDTYSGRAARYAMYDAGFYVGENVTMDSGGTLKKSVAKHVKVYKDADALADAMDAGEVDLGVMLTLDSERINEQTGRTRLDAYRECYGGMSLKFRGASVKGADEASVARDFLQFVYRTA